MVGQPAGKAELVRLKLMVPFTNMIIVGLTLGEIGGETMSAAPWYSITVQCFQPGRPDEIFDYHPKADWTSERKPKPPLNLLTWFRWQEEAFKVFCCTFGVQHHAQSGIPQAAVRFKDMCEEDPHGYPEGVIMDVWEELW